MRALPVPPLSGTLERYRAAADPLLTAAERAATAARIEAFSQHEGPELQAALEAFAAASPDFQTEHGYAVGRFEDELLTLASKWVAHRFGCVSLTLEMPFKDNANLPDGIAGWSGERSMRLGAAMLAPILQHLAG